MRTAEYKECTYYTDRGSVRPTMKNTKKSAAIMYYRFMPNPMPKSNRYNIAEKIRVVLTANASVAKALYEKRV